MKIEASFSPAIFCGIMTFFFFLAKDYYYLK